MAVVWLAGGESVAEDEVAGGESVAEVELGGGESVLLVEVASCEVAAGTRMAIHGRSGCQQGCNG